MTRVKSQSMFAQALILLALTLFPSPVFAAPPTKGEDPKARADALYQEGTDLFSHGDFQSALDRFEKAMAIYQQIGDGVGEGMSKAQALQQAQKEVRAGYPHPYYWAAFVLTGDPGTTAEELATGKSLTDALTSWGCGLF